MHQIYEDGGKYDVIYFLPKISISFAISYYITVIIKIIFLPERNLYELRKQSILSSAYTTADKEKKNLVIKFNYLLMKKTFIYLLNIAWILIL